MYSLSYVPQLSMVSPGSNGVSRIVVLEISASTVLGLNRCQANARSRRFAAVTLIHCARVLESSVSV